MTKAELREKLLGGAIMDDLFAFRNGQDCEIFKAARFGQGDDIIYIPDLALNLIPVKRPEGCRGNRRLLLYRQRLHRRVRRGRGEGQTLVLVLRLAASVFGSA